ncbi:MAG: ATP-binding cassette domain-containing protein [Dethiobacteria bacterium]
MRVEEGGIFGFVGPNGAGKSTTIRTLLNLIFPSSGHGRIFGLDVARDSVQIRKGVGYLGGETGYYDDLTVEGLLRYTASFHRGDFTVRIRELRKSFWPRPAELL